MVLGTIKVGMMNEPCMFKDCDKQAIGWGRLKGKAEHSVDPNMPTETMAPLCAEHMKC